MKKALVSTVGLLLSMSMIFTGCSTAGQTGKSEPSATQPTKSAEGSYALKVGSVFAPGSAADQGTQKFKELVEKKTNGKVKIEIFNNGQLGGDKQMLDSMKFGAIDSVVVGETVFAMFTPKFAGMSLPYLFRDVDHLHKVLDGPVGNELKEEFNRTLDATVLDWWDRNARNLTANKEIKSPDDLEGLKLRVPESPVIVESWRALGAIPTPMAFTELFTALETKVVDGQENPLDLIYSAKLHEVQSHVMLTEHTITPLMVFMSNKKLASLPDDIQKAIREAAVEAGIYQKDVVKKSEEEYIKKLKEAGTNVIEVDKSLFAKKLQEANIEAKFEDQWAPNLIQRIRDTK